ncbi:hypothetical protein ElyMa_003096800 [Elysia marginata]|uniref:Uncharacterized protein n=1 Tax=Elysia marginata TaxID=1093978 RepID=A0AAV4IT18_9GAST|nr:hypothetical protein ElyMa_003096800 [Elysia marginata]
MHPGKLDVMTTPLLASRTGRSISTSFPLSGQSCGSEALPVCVVLTLNPALSGCSICAVHCSTDVPWFCIPPHLTLPHPDLCSSSEETVNTNRVPAVEWLSPRVPGPLALLSEFSVQ